MTIKESITMNNQLINLEVIKSTPAEVEFNKSAILATLDQSLEKYKGVVLTPDTAKDVKKLKQELSKGKKAINDFKVSKKKELSANIKTFEEDCKEIMTKIDSVMNPLDIQVKEYEQRQKDEKLKKWKDDKAFAVDFYGLDEKRAEMLVPRKDALNLSISLKKMKEGIMDDAKTLMDMQKAEASKIELIKMHIENTNLKLALNVEMKYQEFESMLDKDIADIKERINTVGQSRKESEQNAIKKIEKQAEQKANEKAAETIQAVTQQVDKYIAPEIEGEKEHTWSLRITTTESKKDALKAYMDDMGIVYEVK